MDIVTTNADTLSGDITREVMMLLGGIMQAATSALPFQHPVAEWNDVAKNLGFVFGEFVAVIEFGILSRSENHALCFDENRIHDAVVAVPLIIRILKQKYGVEKFEHLCARIAKTSRDHESLVRPAGISYQQWALMEPKSCSCRSC